MHLAPWASVGSCFLRLGVLASFLRPALDDTRLWGGRVQVRAPVNNPEFHGRRRSRRLGRALRACWSFKARVFKCAICIKPAEVSAVSRAYRFCLSFHLNRQVPR